MVSAVSSSTQRHLESRIRRAFDVVGARGWMHVLDIDDERTAVDVDGSRPVALASTFKLFVAVALARKIDAKALDPEETLRLGPERTPGPTGIAAMRDPVEVSLRDLAYLMLAVSDNAACDALFDRLGERAIADAIEALGLRSTVVRGPSRSFVQSMLEDLDASSQDELRQRLRDPGALHKLSVLDPARTSVSTAREMARLLAAIWRDEAASPAGCAELRRLLRLQLWPHRLAAGFPADDVGVAGKTGTLPGLRTEVGVVELPAGRRFAAAVFTRSPSATANLPQVDAVIGQVARMAVDALEAAEEDGRARA